MMNWWDWDASYSEFDWLQTANMHGIGEHEIGEHRIGEYTEYYM